MFNFLKKKYGTGALLDTRPEEEKQKDYRFEEIVAQADPVNWVEKPQSEWRRFPVRNQNGSGSCVSQSLSTIMGVLHYIKEGEFIDFSAGFVYQQRANKPASGMAGVDAWEIVRKKGIIPEQLFPSQNKNDDELDKYPIKDYEYKIAEIFRINNYVVMPIQDIDVIASTIQKTKKAIMVWYFWKYDEWDRDVPEVRYPELPLYASTTARHSVTATDFTLFNGKKALIIQDSWGKRGINGLRVITEDFHKKRNFFAAYPINFNFEELPEKPKWTFNRDLYYGMTNDKDVEMLQRCLAYLKLFPNEGSFTGNFFGLTLRAVKDYQKQYNLPQTGFVGPQTRQVLNNLFSQ
jgi:hypothetical protein